MWSQLSSTEATREQKYGNDYESEKRKIAVKSYLYLSSAQSMWTNLQAAPAGQNRKLLRTQSRCQTQAMPSEPPSEIALHRQNL